MPLMPNQAMRARWVPERSLPRRPTETASGRRMSSNRATKATVCKVKLLQESIAPSRVTTTTSPIRSSCSLKPSTAWAM